jgi:hypothetical protein
MGAVAAAQVLRMAGHLTLEIRAVLVQFASFGQGLQV